MKTALITGAGRGIGRAIAVAYAKSGMQVCLVARTAEQLEETRKIILEEAGNEPVVCSADVCDVAQMTAAFEQCSEEFGGLNVVVANAGAVLARCKLTNSMPADWQALFNTNVFGLVNTCRLAVQFIQSPGGSIITIGSGMGHRAGPGLAAYAASKAATWSITKSLAQEVMQLGIHVNELIPGPVKTAMNPQAAGGDWKEPEEVTPLALYLANLNSRGPTGQSFSLMRK